MATKLIPFKQGLKLHELTLAIAECQAAMMAIQQQAVSHRLRLVTALEFAEIPTNLPLSLKIEDGPDAAGMVAIEWTEPPPSPPEAKE